MDEMSGGGSVGGPLSGTPLISFHDPEFQHEAGVFLGVGFEYRVVWQWVDEQAPQYGAFGRRERVFKTRKGAQRLFDKLMSNGGRFDKWTDGTGIQTGELVVERLRLDFARIDCRAVADWACDLSGAPE